MGAPRTPRRADVLDVVAGASRAIHSAAIATQLDIGPRQLDALSRVLDDLVLDGTLKVLAGHRFVLAASGKQKQERGRTEEGFLTVHPRGFGFVATDPSRSDVFVREDAMLGAMHGDRVRVRVTAESSRGPEGVIQEILERRKPRVSGVLRLRRKSAWLEPDDSRVRGPIVIRNPRAEIQAEDGDLAIVTIDRFPETPDENPEGTLVEVLGQPGDPRVEVRKILMLHGVEEDHPESAVIAAEAYGREISKEALEGREDLTHLPLPTIDPIDARDHDDAVWAERLAGGGYRIWIAIADVSHYVTPDSALDAAAGDRGCSVYLPDRAIPMLPHALSGNLCSLLPDVLRLCMCVEVDLDAHGVPQKNRLIEGFMRSQAKLSYDGVARVLGMTTKGPIEPLAESMKQDLELLREISTKLRKLRMDRGALDLEVAEVQVKVDPGSLMPSSIDRRARDPGIAKAYQIVEEMMLLANETVAQVLIDRKLPAVFRVHAQPDPEKIQRFAAMCEKLGVEFDPEDAADPQKLSVFTKQLRDHEQRPILDQLLVRSLKQAIYDVTNIGHFGLASKAYAHFTSPIRRYPDLVVHRLIRQICRKQRIDTSDEALETLRAAAQIASERERRAMKVEREVVDLYRALYMQDHVGEMFAATVTGIVAGGIYVSIDDPFVEVFIRVESLGKESYEMDEDGLCLVATRSGERIGLSDTLMVLVEEASIIKRAIYGRRVIAEGEAVADKPANRAERRGGKPAARASDKRDSRRDRGGAGRGRGNPDGSSKGGETDRGDASRPTDERTGGRRKPKSGKPKSGKPKSGKPTGSGGKPKSGKPKSGKPKSGKPSKKRS